jgi:uncharacterized integral membrane protein (TIGR00697 family)
VNNRDKLYLYLSAIFVTALLIGDTIGAKLFTATIFGVHATLSVGAIWFPITFLLTDTVNEFYGSAGARSLTFLGFWMALFAFGAIFVARFIPAASFSPVSQDVFNNVFGSANRIFFASLVAYLLGQLIDIAVFQYAKRLTQSKHIWLRSTGSTLLSQLIDTVVVTYIAFAGTRGIDAAKLRELAVTSYFVKVLFAIGLTPAIYALHGLLHHKLGMQAHPADVERVHDAVG